ncbi:MAG: iron-containing alcohol dehydrogenase, partial [Treponema sp.]|nr:iron-containing alcohol dehydrogenase [Treponema sp.]
LLHHAGGHAVRSGLIDRVKASLKSAGVEWVELDGVKPNPRLSLVYKGIDIVRKEKLDFLLAVGGGSVIDSTKAIAMGAFDSGDVWDFFEAKRVPSGALPLGTILTIPATGSESSDSTVITNEEKSLKRGVNSDHSRPRFSILNPELSYSLSPFQSACGIVDMMSHILERYFTREEHVELTDELCEGALRTIIRNGRRILAGDGRDYDARAETMWAGALAHNGLLGTGRLADWASHRIGHEMSAMYDIAHGASLSIIFPAWMTYVIDEDVKRFARFAAKVWGVDGAFYDYRQAAAEGILRMKEYFRSLGMPVSFADAGLDLSGIGEMARKAVLLGPQGKYRSLGEQDIAAIYRIASA